MSPGGEVQVWHIDLDTAPTLPGVLSEAELARLATYADPVRRQGFLVVRGAVRTVLGALLDRPPDELRFRTGPRGKPGLDGGRTRFSLTHAGSFALLAVTGDREVGVDLERPRPRQLAESIAARFFPPDERALVLDAEPADRPDVYLRLWTRKEACVKAAGVRLVEGLRLPVRRDLVADPAGRLPGPWLVRDVGAATGYRAAVALSGPVPYRVVVRQWPSDLPM